MGTVLTMYILTEKPDPSMMCNGLLAGLVAITAPCAFVNSAGAVTLGFIAGVIVVGSVFFVERVLKLDDPVGRDFRSRRLRLLGCAQRRHLRQWLLRRRMGRRPQADQGRRSCRSSIMMAAAATLTKYAEMTGTDPKAGGWTDVGVTGILGAAFRRARGRLARSSARSSSMSLVNFLFVFSFAFIWFKLSNLIVPIRSKRDDEIEGLDIPEMGAEAYPDFQLTDKTSPPVT